MNARDLVEGRSILDDTGNSNESKDTGQPEPESNGALQESREPVVAKPSVERNLLTRRLNTSYVRGKVVSIADRCSRSLKQPQRAFLLIGVVFGLLMLLFNPPLRVNDEHITLFKSYSVSGGHFTAERMGSAAGSLIPKSYEKTVEQLKLIPNGDYKLRVKDIELALKIPLKNNDRFFINYSSWAILTYSPINFVPQALGVEIGKLFNLSPVIHIYLGRIFNLLLWLFLSYLAILVTPIHKWVFFLLCLMPKVVNLAASLSADSITIALIFLTIAYFLKLALDDSVKSISRRQLFFIFLLAFLLSLAKPLSSLLLLLFLMVPSKKFGGKKKYAVVFTLLLLFAVFVFAGWSVLGMGGATHFDKTISPSAQLKFMVTHPFAFTEVFLRTIRRAKQVWVFGITGELGWGQILLPIYFVYIFYFILIAVAALDKDDRILLKARQKAVALLTIVVYCSSLLVLSYLENSPVKDMFIQGIQPRYFIPILPLFLLLFYNQAIKYRKGKYFYVSILTFILLVMVITIVKIATYYYL